MVRPNDTKELLEIKALHFFAENDYERSSLNDIAQALGVTKGAIYHYFTGKDDLFRASASRLIDIMEQWFISSMPEDIPLKVLMEGLFQMEEVLEGMGTATGLGDAVTDYENTMYLVLAALKKFPELKKRMDRVYGEFRKALEAVMRTAIERGEVRADADIVAVAYEITAFYEGALLIGALSDRKDYAELGPRVCRAIWERIAVNDGLENDRPETAAVIDQE